MLPGIGGLEALEVYVAEPELVGGVEASDGRRTLRRVGYLRVVASESEGWGELAALDRPVGRDPDLDASLGALSGEWRSRLEAAAMSREGACPPSHVIEALGGGSAADRMAGAAVEMALLDAELRHAGQSMGSWLGVDAESTPFGALLGIPESRRVEDLLGSARAALDAGASRLRVKVAPGWASTPVAALRAALPGIPLQVDANGSLDGKAGFEELEILDRLSLSCLEEPISGFDLAATWALSGELETPVCLDESLTSHRAVRDAIRYEACDVFCIKPGRLGGIRAALRCLDEVAAAGKRAFIGGMHETGLGRASLGILSLHPACELVSDVVAPGTYLDQDPCGLRMPENGRQPLFTRPGVGPWPERPVLEAL